MRKIKELLLFTALLIMPIVLFLVISGFSVDVLSDRPHFVGIENYIRMFSNDKIFGKALLNTLLGPVIVSFLLASVFVIIVFLVRKKIEVRRRLFYLGSVIIGGLSTLIYTSYLSIMFPLTTSNLYAAHLSAAQMIISHTNVLFSLYIGIFTAFIFWIIELIVDNVKNFIRKRNM